MARFQFSEFGSRLKKDITNSDNYPFRVILRLPIATTFSYPEEKGWKDYVSTGNANPIGLRALTFWNYPYFLTCSLRTVLMKGVDKLVLGNQLNSTATPWWGISLKCLASLIAVVEFPCFLISKLGDKITGNEAPKAEVKKGTALPSAPPPVPAAAPLKLVQKLDIKIKPTLFEQLINFFTLSSSPNSEKPVIKPSTPKQGHGTTWNIDEHLTTKTHDVHKHSKQVSATIYHPVFGKNRPEYTKEKYDELKLKYFDLKKTFNSTDPSKIRKMADLSQLIEGPESFEIRANRIHMLEKFYHDKRDSSPHSAYNKQKFQSDWETLKSLIHDLSTATDKKGETTTKSDENNQPHIDHKH